MTVNIREILLAERRAHGGAGLRSPIDVGQRVAVSVAALSDLRLSSHFELMENSVELMENSVMSPVLKFAISFAMSLALQPAHAQMLGPLGTLWETNVTLTQSDLNLIRTVLSQQIHNKQPGTSIRWRNPESGNSGSLTLLNAFARQGRRCEQIEYRMSPPEPAKPSDRFVLTSCMQPDGSWKLA
jgi:17 kDa outer membrane surface antigen